MVSEISSSEGKQKQVGEEAASIGIDMAREEKPTNVEILLWYMYELCSYFIHTVLIPIVFPLIISQTVSAPSSALKVSTAVRIRCRWLMHAFGRVLWLDCSPRGREGAFSVWYSWARVVGACAGFGLATAIPGDIGKAFGVSFCAGVVGMIVVIFGNISSLGGAQEAGHVVKSEHSLEMDGFEDDSKESIDA